MPTMFMTGRRCDLFNKAYTHISDHIDQVYKELTKGKASPMGGVAYLSLEDSEVRRINLVLPELHHSRFTRNLIMVVSSIMLCLP